MPYYRIEDADTGEVLADNVYLPYDYYDGDAPTSTFGKAVSKIIMLGIKILFLVLPLVVLLCLYPYLLLGSINDGSFDIVDSVLANPFSYIWLALLVMTIVKLVGKIKTWLKIKNCQNKETTTLDEDDCEDARKKSELAFLSSCVQIVRYVYVGATALILIYSLIPVLPPLDTIYINVLSIIGGYLFVVSLLFRYLDQVYSSDEDSRVKQALSSTFSQLLLYVVLSAVVAGVMMLISKSDNVLLSAVMLTLNVPYMLTHIFNKNK